MKKQLKILIKQQKLIKRDMMHSFLEGVLNTIQINMKKQLKILIRQLSLILSILTVGILEEIVNIIQINMKKQLKTQIRQLNLTLKILKVGKKEDLLISKTQMLNLRKKILERVIKLMEIKRISIITQGEFTIEKKIITLQ